MNTVSIIFPSRSRIEETEQLLLSIEKHTNDKTKIDVVGICDQDDTETINVFQKTSFKLSYEFKFICVKQIKNLDLPNHYYSLGLDLSEGSYFKWILGNDCVINTPGWDLELEKLISSSEFQSDFISNKYYYIFISDDTHWRGDAKILEGKDFDSCCFPIISSNYCQDLKEFYPRENPIWGGDIKLFNLAKRSKKFTILNYREKISILHKCFHNKSSGKDEIFYRVSSNSTPLHQRYNRPLGAESLLKDIIEKRIKFLEISNPLN